MTMAPVLFAILLITLNVAIQSAPVNKQSSSQLLRNFLNDDKLTEDFINSKTRAIRSLSRHIIFKRKKPGCTGPEQETTTTADAGSSCASKTEEPEGESCGGKEGGGGGAKFKDRISKDAEKILNEMPLWVALKNMPLDLTQYKKDVMKTSESPGGGGGQSCKSGSTEEPPANSCGSKKL